ncbi:lipoprotein insertase outer membrane protein LolB [Inhella gelatinilytica]|uniref:Outer-membrane lipoprotein LolB n=1 Tax=Inhella gelatinilytica TaxID=2795030 RepID=A0A931IRG8_9BURK|nr:lipoprotein insertase outer membrane protein LolB [Inhella gelatinilytica]MBH9551320.1 hypothetical protein [Inhella gelatinilytica]
MNIRHALALLTVGLALVLTGCVTTPPPPTPGTWSGKLAYQMEASPTQRAQAGSALFEWQGSTEQGQLSLTSPLGTTLASARWDASGVWLDDGHGPRPFVTLEELGQALGDALQGPPLPLRPLLHWLRREPAPGWPALAREDGFEQAGWRVQLAPQRITLTRPAQGGLGALRLVLISTE